MDIEKSLIILHRRGRRVFFNQNVEDLHILFLNLQESQLLPL
jgi:hypothetical protein